MEGEEKKLTCNVCGLVFEARNQYSYWGHLALHTRKEMPKLLRKRRQSTIDDARAHQRRAQVCNHVKNRLIHKASLLPIFS